MPPSVSLYPTPLFDDLDFGLLEFEEHDNLIQAGVMVEGDAAAYALVWEWGNVRQTQKGPNTTLGINPDGERVWLSIQAPFGYIRISTPQFWQVIEEEMAKVKFHDITDARQMTEDLAKVANRAAKRIAEIIKENAPVDSGELQSSIQAVDSNDAILARGTDRWETLTLEEA